jgi:hypothetical protein
VFFCHFTNQLGSHLGTLCSEDFQDLEIRSSLNKLELQSFAYSSEVTVFEVSSSISGLKHFSTLCGELDESFQLNALSHRLSCPNHPLHPVLLPASKD